MPCPYSEDLRWRAIWMKEILGVSSGWGCSHTYTAFRSCSVRLKLWSDNVNWNSCIGSRIKGLKRDQGSQPRDQGSQPRDLESQRVGSGSAVFFMEWGIRLTTTTGSGIKILIVFGIRDQRFGKIYRISYEKIYTVIEKDHLGDWSPEKDCC